MRSATSKPQAFDLQSSNGERPALVGVQVNGQLDGILFGLTVRQTYRNTSPSVLEVIYSFPMPAQAVLLGFASELNGERKVGSVTAKAVAERQYEKALAGGDAPVMLEAGADGVHTANIGNLKPGDELVLEVRLAQLLRFEQGRLRLFIPSTIAPRYGNAEAAGLQPQQVPHPSLTVEYPLQVSVAIAAGLATGSIDCPTHRFTRKAQEGNEGAVDLDLAQGAWLDRDVVITVTPREQRQSFAVSALDTVPGAATTVLMAALQPPPSTSREYVALKLLVDCSGSMGGDSIASARAALMGVVNALQENDQVSLSRFGSTVEHGLNPGDCNSNHLEQLRAAVSWLEADLGGTEMASALASVFGLAMKRDPIGSDVLLVTDGEVWGAEALAKAAKDSGHRVFVIGVGSSPAETVLRTLAEATGGACEFVTPGEALEAAASRMLVRIRQQPWREARIDWGCEAVWQSTLPRSVFGGDTVIAFAGVADAGARPTIRMLATGAGGTSHELARTGAEETVAGDALPRMAAHSRLAQADPAQAESLAVSYQLLTGRTNCILVHERAAADKSDSPAVLQHVPPMMAAGWGALSTAMQRGGVHDFVAHSIGQRPLLAMLRSAPPAQEIEVFPCYEALSVDGPTQTLQPNGIATLNQMVAIAMAHFLSKNSLSGLADHGESLMLHDLVRDALDKAIALGCTPDEAWLILAHWISSQGADQLTTAAMLWFIKKLDPSKVALVQGEMGQLLSGQDRDHWPLSREDRLRQAMGG